MGNTKNKPLSPIKEGRCPHCETNLTFSESERKGGEKIKCPKCGKEFEINEVKKKGKGCLILVIILAVFFIIGMIAIAGIEEEAEEDIPTETSKEIEDMNSEEQSLSHEQLLEISEEDSGQVIGESYKMTLYLEQKPSTTQAGFMSQEDDNSMETILITCNMSSEDLGKLDGESAQNRIYLPYELVVEFKSYDEVVGLYYEADCSFREELKSEDPVVEEETESGDSTVEEELESTEYPRLTEETMDRNLVLSCEGGDDVVLWDLPTSAGEGAKSRDRVPCGTYGWAFNQYYNESLGITFYAINTLDERVDNAYGWITEDLIIWKE
jgi:hypothetical protein